MMMTKILIVISMRLTWKVWLFRVTTIFSKIYWVISFCSLAISTSYSFYLLDSWFKWCLNVGVIKLLSAPELKSIIANKLFMRNILVTTKGSRITSLVPITNPQFWTFPPEVSNFSTLVTCFSSTRARSCVCFFYLILQVPCFYSNW